MYTPVVARFLSYLPDLAEESLTYCHAVRESSADGASGVRTQQRNQLDWRLAHYEDVA